MVDSTSFSQRRALQYITAIGVSIGAFALGCSLGWSNPAASLLRTNMKYSDIQIDIIGATLPLGAAIAVLFVPIALRCFGRRALMLLLVPFLITSWLLVLFSLGSIYMFIAGRFVMGACAGFLCVLVPIYNAEISSKEIRGRLGVFFQLFLVGGILYVYAVGYCKELNWITSLCILWPIFFGVAAFFVTESPFSLVSRNEMTLAKQTIIRLKGIHYDVDSELEEIQISLTKKTSISWNVLKQWPVVKTFSIAYALMAAQQLCGINAVIFNGETIFAIAKTEMDATTQNVIIGIVQVMGCFIAAAIVDMTGRKLLLILSEIIMGICLVILAIFFLLKEKKVEGIESFGWLPVLAMSIYIIAFSIGAGPIPWAYMGEIFPANLKGLGSSTAAFVNWMLAFAVTVSFKSIINATSPQAVFFFFSGACFLSVFFIVFCLIETKGKTFAEIQKEFGMDKISESNFETSGRSQMLNFSD